MELRLGEEILVDCGFELDLVMLRTAGETEKVDEGRSYGSSEKESDWC